MLEIIDDPVEQMTAITDFAMAIVAGVGVAAMLKRMRSDPFKIRLWIVTYLLFINAAVLGTAYHGLALPERWLDTLWTGIFVSLGFMVALFVVALVRDSWSEAAAKKAIPVMLVIAAGFILASYLMGQDYRIAIAYQAVALLAAFVGYGWLAFRGVSGANVMTAGVGLTIAAAAVQAGELISLTPDMPFDHNSAYHVIQCVGVLFLTRGVTGSIDADARASR